MLVDFSSILTPRGDTTPDPQLLALHATCVRVVHTSGAAEFFDRLERDTEETSIIAFDDSSARRFSDLASPYSVLNGTA